MQYYPLITFFNTIQTITLYNQKGVVGYEKKIKMDLTNLKPVKNKFKKSNVEEKLSFTVFSCNIKTCMRLRIFRTNRGVVQPTKSIPSYTVFF